MPNSWCNSASIRREQIESVKDLTFNEVFEPLIINRISELSPKRILEVGAGTGHISKSLSVLGFKITAIEPSKGMYKIAQDVLSKSQVKLINCSSFDLEKVELFDMAISHLVTHVVDDLVGFFSSIAKHLTSEGHFIFSIPHPCFYNDYKHFFGDDYNYMVPANKNVSFTITKDTENTISDVPYHHRPLSMYMNTVIKADFVIIEFEEIYPDEAIQEKYGAKWEAPRYCVFICKKL